MKNEKLALISGSSRGIGKSIAHHLAANNYTVYITGRTKEDVEQTVAKIGPLARPFIGDLSDQNTLNALLEQIQNEKTNLDLLVANMGNGNSSSGWKVDIEEYRTLFEQNFFSSINLCTKAAELMVENNNGHIVLISSIAGCESLGAPIAYTTAKSALLAFAKSFSDELAKDNIRVNTISPGNILFKSGTWDKKLKKDKNTVLKYIQDNIPLNTFGSPEDIAKAVLFLEESPFATGTNLILDGGQVRRSN